jgi:serine protease
VRRSASVVAAVCAAALTAALSPVATAAAAPSATATSSSGHQVRTAREHAVTRLIVRTRSGAAPSTRVRSALARISGAGSAPAPRRLGRGQSLLELGRPMSPAAAWAAARALARQPDVLWAEPDLWVYPSEASPVTPNDPSFAQQWDLWDAAAVHGGYSTRAPAAWSRTKGRASIVVAVLDTGLTVHPDITSSVSAPKSTDQTVKGYDFVSGDGAVPESYVRANDGNGWDSDPSDPGDWITAAEDEGTAAGGLLLNCGGDNPDGSSDSSWHGTHVTGTIVARQGNAAGISGIAPGVKVEPVRVLGKCGGSSSDIAAAIRWAAGDPTVLGTANPNPAKVINMSLGGPGACLATTQSAIDYARSKGVTVVVAAGNDGAPMEPGVNGSPGSQPADCTGVVRVAASTRAGGIASYSDTGTSAVPVTVAAPGGDFGRQSDDILSTINLGRTTPGASGYAWHAGTSMATPHVAAAVALLQSRVTTLLTPDQVAARLQATATRFALGAGCTTDRCGAGVVDIGAALVDQPAPPPSASASPSDSAAYVTWDVPADNGSALLSYRVRGTIDGGAAKDVATVATGTTSLRVTQFADGTPLTNGHSYAFTVAAVNGVGEGPRAGTAAVVPSNAPPPDQPAAPTATGGVEHLTATWSAPATGAAPTGYAVRFRLVGTTAWTCAAASGPALGGASAGTCSTVDAATRSLDATTWPLPMAAGRYQVQVAARNAHGPSVWSDSGTTTVVALAESFRLSASTLRPYPDGFQDVVDIGVRSNRPGGDDGELRIVNGRGTTVRSFRLGLATTQTVRWDGRDRRGAIVPRGAYRVVVRLHGRGATPSALPQQPVVTVASTQASKPTIRLSSAVVYPYVDGYRDSITVTTADAVPSVMTWSVVRGGRTYWSSTWARSLSVTKAYGGVRSSGGILPAGRYTLVVTAKAGEGVRVSSSTVFTVRAERVQRRWFSETGYALSAMQDAVGNRTLPGAWGRRAVYLPDQSQATFAHQLPPTVRAYRTVRVTVTSSGDFASGRTGKAVPLGGYFTGNPLDPSSFGQANALTAGSTTLPPASAAEVSGGLVRWYVANNALSIDGSTTSKWVVVSFTVTGYRFVLV